MDVKLPNLGEGAESGTVVNLFVKEGDQIAKDQPILELENEKAVATIPSTAGGTVLRVFVKTGEKLSVGQRILSLGDGGAGAAAAAPAALKTQRQPERDGQEGIVQTPSPVASQEQEPAEEAPARTSSPPPAAPSIRKLARDLGIDLSRVRGTARGGRILLDDVRNYI